MQIADPDALKRLMASRELTQTDLGELAGVSRQLIGHLLSGERTTCKPESAEKICRALFVPLAAIFVPRTSASSGQNGKPKRSKVAA